MKDRTDWLAWSLHFVFGLFVGAACSLLFVTGGRRRMPLIASETAPTFVIGVALIGAALGSLHGDWFWLGYSTRVIPPDAPQQSVASRCASRTVGAVGISLVLLAVGRTLGLVS